MTDKKRRAPTPGDYQAKIASLWDLPAPEDTPPPARKDLERILGEHKAWIESIRDSEAKLSGRRARLAGMDLRGVNLARRDLRGADLAGANLAGARLEGALLTLANLSNADLRNADLRGAKVRKANLCGAKLEGADLGGADLETE